MIQRGAKGDKGHDPGMSQRSDACVTSALPLAALLTPLSPSRDDTLVRTRLLFSCINTDRSFLSTGHVSQSSLEGFFWEEFLNASVLCLWMRIRSDLCFDLMVNLAFLALIEQLTVCTKSSYPKIMS